MDSTAHLRERSVNTLCLLEYNRRADDDEYALDQSAYSPLSVFLEDMRAQLDRSILSDKLACAEYGSPAEVELGNRLPQGEHFPQRLHLRKLPEILGHPSPLWAATAAIQYHALRRLHKGDARPLSESLAEGVGRLPVDLQKIIVPQDLRHAIEAAYRGEVLLSPAIAPLC